MDNLAGKALLLTEMIQALKTNVQLKSVFFFLEYFITYLSFIIILLDNVVLRWPFLQPFFFFEKIEKSINTTTSTAYFFAIRGTIFL